MSRVFHGKYKVNKVFPLGGRGVVIEHHANITRIGRPTLHIIDGDLFLLVGDDIKSCPGLYVSSFYCIENLLCDIEAILDFLNEEDPINSREHLTEVFDHNKWTLHNKNPLFELFVEYAVSFRINPPEKTVAFPVKDLVSSNEGNIDSEKSLRRIDELKGRTVSVAGEDEYLRVKKEILLRFEQSGLSKFDVVSGKDYLLPLLKCRCKLLVKSKVPDINIKTRLAMKCSVNKIVDAKNYVICPS